MSYKQYPTLLFEEKTHEYRWHGVVKPSVTQVLSSVAVAKDGVFIPIADNRFCHNVDAANFGKAFHKIIAGILTGKNVTYPKEMFPYITQWGRWRENHADYVPMADEDGRFLVEYPMYSERFGFTGTLDAVFIPRDDSARNRHLLLVDWKTATSEMPYWKYQTAAYEVTLREVFKSLIGNRRIVREAVRFEEATYLPEQRKNNPEDWIVFQSALNLRKAA